jgi:hypothetical protein
MVKKLMRIKNQKQASEITNIIIYGERTKKSNRSEEFKVNNSLELH